MPCDLQYMQLGTEEIAHTHRVPILPLFSSVHLMTQGRNYLGKKTNTSPPPPQKKTPSQAKNVHFVIETYFKGKKANKCKLLTVIPFPLT